MAELLERFAPYGIGNPEPLLYIPEVHVQQAQVLNGGHLRFTVRQGGNSVPCIAFGLADRQHELEGAVDLLAALQVNRWNGRQSPQLMVRDFRASTKGAP